MGIVRRQLKSGVTVFLLRDNFAPVTAVYCRVDVGSLSENAGQRGMAHFLEHMLFKGTTRRSGPEIAGEIEAVGGEINAYTSFEATVIHATVPAQAAMTGLDVVLDVACNSTLPEAEFKAEQEVICEEIRRLKDSPGALVGHRVFAQVFPGTEAGRPVIGSEADIQKTTRDQLAAFYRQWYQPRNTTYIICGDFDMDAVLGAVDAAYGTLPPSSVGPGERREQGLVPYIPAHGPEVSLLRTSFDQHRLALVFPAPALDLHDATCLDAAAFALGSGELGRLNMRLRDELALVTSVSVSSFTPRFGSLFEVTCLLDPGDFVRAIEEIAYELARLLGAEPICEADLDRARINLKADRIYRDETVEGRARSLAAGLGTEHSVFYDENYCSVMDGLTPAEVTDAARQWILIDRPLIIGLVSQAFGSTEAELVAAYQRGLERYRKQIRRPSGRILPQDSGEKKVLQPETSEPVCFEIGPGKRLIYRRRNGTGLFTMTAATEGGLRAEDKASPGLFNAMAGMLGMASGQFSYTDMMSRVEGSGAVLEGFSGKDSVGLYMQCLIEDSGPMLDVFVDVLCDPVFPEDQWAALQRELLQSLVLARDSAAAQCLRRFQMEIYGEHPYRCSVQGTEESVSSLSSGRLRDAFLGHRDQGRWVFSAVGPWPSDMAASMIGRALEGFNPQGSQRRFGTPPILNGTSARKFSVDIVKEQTHIVCGYPGISWHDRDRYAQDVLVSVLGGHSGRLFRKLRDEMSLAYSLSPIASLGVDPGVVGAYIACAPAKTGQAIDGLNRELQRMCTELLQPAELDKARRLVIGNHEMGLQKSDAQTSTMALMDLYGLGHRDFLEYPDKIRSVTADQVVECARRLFRSERSVTVVAGSPQ